MKFDGTLAQAYRLLALCARMEAHPAFREQLAAQVHEFRAWDILPNQAEIHGMAPLLWHHLKASGVEIPDETSRILQGLYLRHRYLNQFHTESLLALTGLLGKAGIHPVVLKGLALAHTIYSDPALRPISDIDLLLPTDEVLPALQMMKEAGYTVNMPAEGAPPREVVAQSPVRDKLRTQIELHHYAPSLRSLMDNTPDTEFKGFLSHPQQITIQGQPILAPNTTDHFHYLWRHLLHHLFAAPSERPLQLKWVADITGLAEYHANEIDWTTIKQVRPDLLRRLEVFYSLSPMPLQFREVIPVREIEVPEGINRYPPGWPQYAYRAGKRAGFGRFLWQTLAPPSRWWLKLYYGIEDRQLFWYGRVVYPLKVIQIFFWRLVKGLKD